LLLLVPYGSMFFPIYIFIGGAFLFLSSIFLTQNKIKIEHAILSVVVILMIYRYSFFSTYEFGIIFLTGIWLYVLFWVFRNKSHIDQSFIEYSLVFFGIWLLFALVQLMWVPISDNTIRHIQYLFSGVSVVIIMVLYVNSIDKIRVVYRAWKIGLSSMLIVGWWEVLTDNHLSKSGALFYGYKNIATGAYFNPNDFAFFLVISIPLTFQMLMERKIQQQIFGLLMLMNSIYFIYLSGARLIYIVLLFISLLFIVYLLLIKRASLVFALFLTLFIGFIFYNELFTDFYQQIITMNTNDKSTDIRGEVTQNALSIIKGNILGVGPGNIESYIQQSSVLLGFNTYGITNTHNWWIEILANYGIVIFILFLLFFIVTMKKIFSLLVENYEYHRYALPIFISLLSFIPACVDPSSIFGIDITWFILGFPLCIINVLVKKNIKGSNG
ncbi:MAG: hypothetical protein K0S55_2084, partial [Clostridia bacterium]|nr:hypothetical protein [Clostridia bacterium]